MALSTPCVKAGPAAFVESNSSRDWPARSNAPNPNSRSTVPCYTLHPHTNVDRPKSPGRVESKEEKAGVKSYSTSRKFGTGHYF